MHTRIGPALDSSPPDCWGGQSPPGSPGIVAGIPADDDAIVTSDNAAPASPHRTGVDPVIAPESLPMEFGGYRVVRVLARSARATTAVVHAAGETRVARVFSTACPDSVIDAELAVHDAIARGSDYLRIHLVALHDLVTLPDGRLALIRELAAGPSLADVLAMRRGQLTLGEAVTILAPLADALDAAHAAGLTGVTFTPAAVRFSAAGAPVVVTVSDAVVGPVLPERFRALEPAYAHDAGRFQQLGAAVTAAVADADRPALAVTLAAPSGARTVSSALFDLASPVPVLLHENNTLSAMDAPAATATASPVPAPAPVLTPVPTVGAPPKVLGTLSAPTGEPAVPRWIVAGVDALRVLGVPASVVDPVRTVAERFAARVAVVVASTVPTLDRVRGVRRGVLIAGAAGVVALIAAIALASGAGGSAGSESVSATESTSRTSTDQPIAGTERASPPPMSPSGESAGDALGELAPETLIDPAPEEWPAITNELVRRWTSCHATVASGESGADQSCASQVAHAGSAAERLIGIDDPRHDALVQWRERGTESVVIDRMGGAALIDLLSPTSPDAAAPTTAASLLVVRSEAGWRVRDVLSGELTD